MRGITPVLFLSVLLAGCVEPGSVPPQDGEEPIAEVPSDSSVVAANTHLARGRPWYAYQALRPALT